MSRSRVQRLVLSGCTSSGTKYVAQLSIPYTGGVLRASLQVQRLRRLRRHLQLQKPTGENGRV